MFHRKWGGGRRRLGTNLRRKVEEGVGGAEGRGERLVTRELGSKKLGFGVEREGSVLCYTVCKLFKNDKQYDLENKLKISLSLI